MIKEIPRKCIIKSKEEYNGTFYIGNYYYGGDFLGGEFYGSEIMKAQIFNENEIPFHIKNDSDKEIIFL